MTKAFVLTLTLVVVFVVWLWYIIKQEPEAGIKLTEERMLELATKLQAHRAKKLKKRLEARRKLEK
jgi:preprotein translocase subunit SecF